MISGQTINIPLELDSKCYSFLTGNKDYLITKGKKWNFAFLIFRKQKYQVIFEMVNNSFYHL